MIRRTITVQPSITSSAFIPWILRFLLGTAAQDKYGLNTFTIRLVPALFGLGTVWLVLLLRRRLGSVGTLASIGGKLAVSPGAVYLSRYYIHETLFVFFTLGWLSPLWWPITKMPIRFIWCWPQLRRCCLRPRRLQLSRRACSSSRSRNPSLSLYPASRSAEPAS